MTEQEWLACQIPSVMAGYICRIASDPRLVHRLKGKAAERKFRLLACALCRRLFPLLSDKRSREAVEVAERYADGIAKKHELRTAHLAANRAADEAWAASAAHGFTGQPHEKWVVARKAAEVAKNVVSISTGNWPLGDTEEIELIHDVFGNPFRPTFFDPSCSNSIVVSLAQAIYEEHGFDRLPILADALEDAGCTNQDILGHCRGPGPHVRGCWVVDLLLGKE